MWSVYGSNLSGDTRRLARGAAAGDYCVIAGGSNDHGWTLAAVDSFNLVTGERRNGSMRVARTFHAMVALPGHGGRILIGTVLLIGCES